MVCFSSNWMLLSFSCVISSRHTSWRSRWGPSKNWQTGWPTCAAWELLKTAWPSTCLTNTPWAKKAAKSLQITLTKAFYMCIFVSCFQTFGKYEAICMIPASHLTLLYYSCRYGNFLHATVTSIVPPTFKAHYFTLHFSLCCQCLYHYYAFAAFMPGSVHQNK